MPGESASDSSANSGQTGGNETELDVLEPEPVTSDSDNAMADASDAAGGSSGGGAEGGGSDGGGADGGGQESNGAMADAGGAAGGGSAGGQGSLDDRLNDSVQIFENGMMEQIIVIASSIPGGDSDSQGGDDELQPGEAPQNGNGTAGGGRGLVIVEGDVSQLPSAAGSAPGGGEDNASGVVDPTQSSDGSTVESSREGDNAVRRILLAKIPDDVGDGSDDDVVARQIREAAINEEDPALREKLWEEYRNYKKSLN